MDAHEVLVAARNLLDREGWRQLTRADSVVHTRCASNAVSEVTDWAGGRDTTGAYRALVEALGLEYRAQLSPIWAWNDAPGRTKQEVLDLFDRAIAATAPEPSFESLGQEPATAREPVIEVFA